MKFTKTPTDTVFSNWLIEVENIINSRPLTHVSVGSEEEAVLTSNHFLLDLSSGIKPITSFDDSSAVLRNNWKTLHLYADQFWQKWLASYLPTLTHRSKWFVSQPPLKLGDLVLIVDDSACTRTAREQKDNRATGSKNRRN